MFTIFCSCGCDNGFVFRRLKTSKTINVSTISSDFYTNQKILNKNIFKNLKEYSIIKNKKEYFLKESCIEKKDIEALLKYLESELPNLANEKVENISKISIKKEIIEKYDYIDYQIVLLTSTKKFKEIVFNTHRKYELELNKKEVLNLIEECKEALK